MKELSSRVKEYNTLLRYMGLKDHQIERVARPLWRSILLLCYRMGLFSVWGLLALPGVILNGPIFVAASVISHMKARGSFQKYHFQFLLTFTDVLFPCINRGACSINSQD